MDGLRFFTLGRVQLEARTGPLLEGRRKPLALLAYLARESPRAVTRGELAALLWGDSTDARARQSVRQALHTLREAVGDTLTVEAESASIDLERLEFDVQRFEHLLVAGHYSEALELWGGDFLVGAEGLDQPRFVRWLEDEQDALRRQAAWAFQRVVVEAEERGDWTRAERNASAWCGLAPLDEAPETYRIRALRALGRETEARGRHAAFVARLAGALDSEPTTAFRLLGEDLAGPSREEVRVGSKALFTADLIGRVPESDVLSECWAAVRSGTSSVVLVRGEAGIGKSRIVNDFLRGIEVGDEPPLVFRGRAYATDRGRAWSAAVDLLASIRGAPGLLALEESDLSQLARLVPTLRERWPNLPDPIGDDASLHRAVRSALAEVSSEVPVVLFLDDAARSDDETLGLVLSLARRPPGPMLIILADRSAELDERLGGELVDLPTLRTLRPADLSLAEIDLLLASMLEMESEERRALGERIFEASGGNPAYATELVAGLADAGHLRLGPLGTWSMDESVPPTGPLPIPPNLKSALRQRLAGLSPDAHKAAAVAAVLGPPVDTLLVEAAARLEGVRLSSALEELVSKRILREEPGLDRYRFGNEMAARMLVRTVAPTERLRIHQAAVEAIEAMAEPDGDRKRRLRSHYEQVGVARWRRGKVVALGMAVATLVVIIVSTSLWQRRPAVSAGSDGVVAVLPFTVRGPDTVAYLGDGLADLLAANLDGAGGLVSVDPYALLTRVQRSGIDPADPASGVQLAREFRAGWFVLGSIVEAGGGLRATASLYSGRGRLRTTSQATVTGEAELFELVDELTRNLLAGRAEGADVSLTRLAAVTTTSLAALKAYLEGEAALRRGRFTQAVDAYQRAVAADTTFALAYYRLAEGSWWLPGTGIQTDVAISAAWDHSARLPERARKLLEGRRAWQRGAIEEAETAYRAILAADPVEVQPWLGMGDVLFWFNGMRGGSIWDAEPYFSRALELDPTDAGARIKLAYLAARRRDYDRHDELVSILGGTEDYGSITSLVHAFARREPALQDSVVAAFGSLDAATVSDGSLYVATLAYDLAGAARVAGILTLPSRPRSERARGHGLRAEYLMAAGRVREAWSELDRARAMGWPDADGLEALWTLEPGTFPGLDRGARVRTRLRTRAEGTGEIAGRAVPSAAYLSGLISIALGDLEGGRSALARLDALEPDDPLGSVARYERWFHASLSSSLALAEGDTTTARTILESASFEISPEDWWNPALVAGWERFRLATLLLELGEPQRAVSWFDGLGRRFGELHLVGPVLFAAGEAYERMGRRDVAADRYRQFIELWRGADPELQPRVEAARRRLLSLGG